MRDCSVDPVYLQLGNHRAGVAVACAGRDLSFREALHLVATGVSRARIQLGALLAWTAQTGRPGLPAVFLYLAGISWTLFYDTIYAHQDREDDALIGVKSTARLFGDATETWLRGFLIATVVLMSLAVIYALSPVADPLKMSLGLAGAWAMGAHMNWQLSKLDINNTQTCLQLFRSNRDAGLLAALFLAITIFV